MDSKRRFAEIGVSLDDEYPSGEIIAQKISDDQIRKVQRFDVDEETTMDDILKLVEEAPEIAQLDDGRLIELTQTLEKSVQKNQQMRTKYADNPKRFMQSEEDLHENIKNIYEISAAPALYTKFVKLGAPKILVDLLLHENTDIVIEVINLLNELSDPSTIFEDERTIPFVESLLEFKIFELLVQNLKRFSESEEDARGLYYTLNIIENLIEIDPSYCDYFCSSTDILSFLLSMIKKNIFDENTFYCAEILATFVNCSPKVRILILGMDITNICMAIFRSFHKKTPETAEQIEYSENMFDILSSCLTMKEYKVEFTRSSGFSALFPLINKKSYNCHLGAIKALTFALTESADNCKAFIVEKGLKVIFAIFMKKEKRTIQKYLVEEDSIEGHILTIIVHLFVHLSGTDYARLLRKFLENDCEKIDRLIEIHDKYLSRVEEFDKVIASSNEKLDSEKRYYARLEKGLDTLQLVDLVIGFVTTAGDLKLKERVFQVLHQQDTDINDVKKTLNEFHKHCTDQKMSSLSPSIVKNVIDIL